MKFWSIRSVNEVDEVKADVGENGAVWYEDERAGSSQAEWSNLRTEVHQPTFFLAWLLALLFVLRGLFIYRRSSLLGKACERRGEDATQPV